MAAMSPSTASSNSARCSALSCSLLALYFSRLSCATSKVSLSILASRQPISCASRPRPLEQLAHQITQLIDAEVVELVGVDLRDVEHVRQCGRRCRCSPSAYPRIARGPGSHHSYHSGFADALPGQSEHQRVELLARDRLLRGACAARPDESAFDAAAARPARCRSRREPAPSGESSAGWRRRRHGAAVRRRRPSRHAQAPCPCRHACPSARSHSQTASTRIIEASHAARLRTRRPPPPARRR